MALTSKQFYTRLKPENLASRKKPRHTIRELAFLKRMLRKGDRILDLACGYGRITIPLAKQGYNVEGIDITPVLIRKARATAKREKLDVKFRLGDMRHLPYKNSSFDAIICIWSAFFEMRNIREQRKAVKEMLKALSIGGSAFMDLPIIEKFGPERKSRYRWSADAFI